MLKERLCALRTDKGETQTALAQMLNITRQAYNHYETGARIPTPETLEQLADYFDVSVDYLLGRENAKKTRPSEDERVLNELLQDPELKQVYDKLTALTPKNRELALDFLETLANHQDK